MADHLVIRGNAPAGALVDAVYVAAAALEVWECYAHEGRYHFTLGGGWTVALSADSADRVRVETCRLTRPEATMWVLAHQHDRLAGLVRMMSTMPEAV
jgi:hypothetical protein